MAGAWMQRNGWRAALRLGRGEIGECNSAAVLMDDGVSLGRGLHASHAVAPTELAGCVHSLVVHGLFRWESGVGGAVANMAQAMLSCVVQGSGVGLAGRGHHGGGGSAGAVGGRDEVVKVGLTLCGGGAGSRRGRLFCIMVGFGVRRGGCHRRRRRSRSL